MAAHSVAGGRGDIAGLCRPLRQRLRRSSGDGPAEGGDGGIRRQDPARHRRLFRRRGAGCQAVSPALRGGAGYQQGAAGQPRRLRGERHEERCPAAPPHPGLAADAGVFAGGDPLPDGRGAVLHGKPGGPEAAGSAAEKAGGHGRGLHRHESGERGGGHRPAPMVEPLPQDPLYRAAGRGGGLGAGGGYPADDRQYPGGDAAAVQPVPVSGGGQRLLFPTAGGDVSADRPGHRAVSHAVCNAPVVSAGEVAGYPPREPALPPDRGRVLCAADLAAAAGGVHYRRAEAGLPQHAGRAQQLLQYAGSTDFRRLCGAGPVAGAGGAGVYGLRGHRQLRPAQLRDGLRREAVPHGAAAAHLAV